MRWNLTNLDYHKKEGAASPPGAQKHNLQYNGRPDMRLGVRVGTWNLGSLNGKGGENSEELRKRMIDVHCLQEERYRGQGARKPKMR